MKPGSGATRSRLFDLVLAVGVGGVALAGSIGETHPKMHGNPGQVAWIHSHHPGTAYALVVLGSLALAGRRRWPFAVLAVSVASVAAYAAAGFVPGAALLAVYVALYTVANLASRPMAIWAGVLSIGIVFISSGAGGPFGWLGGTNTVMIASCVTAVAIGMAVAGRRQVFVAMKERAERAERDREDEARRRVDAERLRIARELHDVVAHTMSMINIQAGVAAHVMPEHPEQAADALNAIKVASREGLQELRAILKVLRQADETPGTEPAPRLTQLAALADAMTQAGLPTSLTFSGERPEVLGQSVELAAYRIVQESLTNVLRHAGPGARARVDLAFELGRLIVQVDDDGRAALVTSGGPARRAVSDIGGGAGIPGMRERAAAFGGSLQAGPQEGGGWRVRAVLEFDRPDDNPELSRDRPS